MRKLIILSFLLFFLKLSSAVKLESVFETSDVGEYNQWVSEHKGEYPELKPVYILGERTGVKEGIKTPTGKTRIYEYRLYYYDDNGNLVNTEDLSGHEMKVTFSPDHDRVIIREWKDKEPYGYYTYTVKNRRGIEIFNKSDRIVFTPDPKRYFLIPYNRYMPIFTKLCRGDGREIREFNDFIFRGGAFASQDNETFLITASKGHIGKPYLAVIIDKDGNEISRSKEFSPDPEKVEVFGLTWTTNKDIAKIAVGFNGVVYVYDRSWNLLHKWEVPSRAHPSVGLSSDGENLVTFGAKTVCLYNLEKGRLIWKNKLEDAGRAGNVTVLPDGKGVVVGTKWPAQVYLLNKTGEIVKYTDLGSKVIRETPNGRHRTRKTYKTMDYKIDVSGDNVAIKVFNKSETPSGFYSEIWKLGEE